MVMNEEIHTVPVDGLRALQKDCQVLGRTVTGRWPGKVLFEEVPYLGLQVVVWRSFAHSVCLDCTLVKVPVPCEEGRRDWLCFLTIGRTDCLAEGGERASLLWGPAGVF